MGKGRKHHRHSRKPNRPRKPTPSSSAQRTARLARHLVEACHEFNHQRPWAHFDADLCVGLRLPSEPHLVVATIIGQAGDEHGICLYRGADAVAQMCGMLQQADPTDTTRWDFLGMTMHPRWQLRPEDLALHDLARLPDRPEAPVPQFLHKRPGFRTRPAKPAEIPTLLYAIRAITTAFSRGELDPCSPLDSHSLQVLSVTGEPARPTFELLRERIDPHPPAPAPALPTVAIPAGLPRLPSTWCIQCPSLPVGVVDDDRELRVLFLLEVEEDRMLHGGLIPGDEPDAAVQQVLAAFAGDNALGVRGLPRRIVFGDQSLFETFAPALEQHGVPSVLEPDHPALSSALTGFLEFMEERAEDPPPPAAPAPRSDVPAADDLAGWKQVEQDLGERIMEEMQRSKRSWERARRRFLGRGLLADDADGIFDLYEGIAIGMAWCEWAAFDDRPTHRSRTFAEKLRERPLPPATQQLLEHHLRGRASLFQVRAVERGAHLDLVDLLDGSEVRLHDFGLSQSLEVGLSIGLRVYQAGDYTFGSLLGPPITPLRISEALDFLWQVHGLDPSDDATAHGGQITNLWTWLFHVDQRGPPELCNTDGEPFVWHRSVYDVLDPAAVRTALDAQPDLHREHATDTWVWLRDNDQIRLGQLEWIGDELLTECNSERRDGLLRARLEEVRGLRWRRVATETVEHAPERPADDRSPPRPQGPPPPEALAAIQEMVERHCMGWLDESLPALGHRTPREVCRTAEGRRKVEGLIRSWPVQEGITVPRDRMRAALGLGSKVRGRGA